MVAPYKPNNIQSAPQGNTGGRGSTRFMNPDDFEAKYGYNYTDDPNFNSRSDAGGTQDLTGSLQKAEASSIGGGYGKKRVGPESRGQMDYTKGQTRSILTS